MSKPLRVSCGDDRPRQVPGGSVGRCFEGPGESGPEGQGSTTGHRAPDGGRKMLGVPASGRTIKYLRLCLWVLSIFFPSWALGVIGRLPLFTFGSDLLRDTALERG